jgi:hypothetical protein
MIMRRRLLPRLAKLGLILGALPLTCSTVMANALVLESTVPGVQRLQELTDDRQLTIPIGAHLQVVISQDSKVKTVQILGPRAGTVAALLRPEPFPERIWNVVKQLAQTGGSDETGVAAARGSRAWLSVMVNGAHPESKGAICVEDGALPTLTRLAESKDTSVVITDRQGRQSSPVDLTALRASWPASVQVRDGGVYRIIPNSSAAVEFRLRVVPSGMLNDLSSVQTLDALEARGCRQQVNAALRKVVSQ